MEPIVEKIMDTLRVGMVNENSELEMLAVDVDCTVEMEVELGESDDELLLVKREEGEPVVDRDRVVIGATMVERMTSRGRDDTLLIVWVAMLFKITGIRCPSRTLVSTPFCGVPFRSLTLDISVHCPLVYV